MRGRPDETFGSGGVAPIPLDGNASVLSAAPDLVVFGSFEAPEGSGIEGRVGAVRMPADGSGLDPAFGTAGMLGLGALAGDTDPIALRTFAVDPRDGSYVAVAVLSEFPEDRAGLIRFSRDGVIDREFGDDGFVTIDVPDLPDSQFGPVRDIDVDSTGRSIVSLENGIVRYLEDGTRDRRFGMVGSLGDSIGRTIERAFVAVADFDKIVACGSRPGRWQLAVYRWDAEGLPDPTFGRNGRIRFPLRSRGGWIRPDSLVLVKQMFAGQPPGDRVFISGHMYYPGGGDPRKAHGGWFGALASDRGTGQTSIFTHRNPRPAHEQYSYVGGSVWAPFGVVAVGTTQIRTPGGDINSAFLMKFVYDR
jgi:hypothetical protein